MGSLGTQRCLPCEGKLPAISLDDAQQRSHELPEWTLNRDPLALSRTFTFENFFETMAFVNAVAWIAHRENHHPDLKVSYKSCRVRYTTHSIDGLSDNDFVCAKLVSELLIPP